MSKPFYVTTAINYPNGKPHIGHAYEAIATDAIARFQRMRGRRVRFQTGVDEHGLKMVQTARDKGLEPATFGEEMVPYFKMMDERLDISYDRFIRTTEAEHHAASQAIWRAMEEKGDLYRGKYEGWYSVRDEAYYEESELVEGEEGEKLSPQGTPVEWTVEESWFFRLSAYQQPLLDLYRDNPRFIRPESRRNEMIRFVEGGLKDLSVSRSSFDWGVKVPGDPDHVMYVWVDALTNYLTGLGYPDENAEDYRTFWAGEGDRVHIIGKDIVRFHSVYWPAFLMSAGLPLPTLVFGHGFLLNQGRKESKSLGNVTDPIDLADNFGVDPLRYFLLREVSFGRDGSYSPDAIVRTANADLSNSFGNLAQRTLSMIHKNMEGVLPDELPKTAEDEALEAKVMAACRDELPAAFDDFDLSGGIEAWMRAVFACNQYVDGQAPWALRKTDPERMKTVLAVLFGCIRTLAIAIRPVVPQSAERLLDQLGISADARDFAALEDEGWFHDLRASGFVVAKPVPLFPRLELPDSEQEA